MTLGSAGQQQARCEYRSGGRCTAAGSGVTSRSSAALPARLRRPAWLGCWKLIDILRVSLQHVKPSQSRNSHIGKDQRPFGPLLATAWPDLLGPPLCGGKAKFPKGSTYFDAERRGDDRGRVSNRQSAFVEKVSGSRPGCP